MDGNSQRSMDSQNLSHSQKDLLLQAISLVALVNPITKGSSKILDIIHSREPVTSLVILHKGTMREWCVTLHIKHWFKKTNHDTTHNLSFVLHIQ